MSLLIEIFSYNLLPIFGDIDFEDIFLAFLPLLPLIYLEFVHLYVVRLTSSFRNSTAVL